jgi:hypothetical protein
MKKLLLVAVSIISTLGMSPLPLEAQKARREPSQKQQFLCAHYHKAGELLANEATPVASQLLERLHAVYEWIDNEEARPKSYWQEKKLLDCQVKLAEKILSPQVFKALCFLDGIDEKKSSMSLQKKIGIGVGTVLGTIALIYAAVKIRKYSLNSQLLSAVDHNDVDRVREAIARGANVNVHRPARGMPLIARALAPLGNTAATMGAFLGGLHLAAQGGDLPTFITQPLEGARQHNNHVMIDLLVNAGAVDLPDTTNILVNPEAFNLPAQQ